MIIVATPTREYVQASTAMDLLSLLRFSRQADWRVSLGSIISNNRTRLVQQATKEMATHILFVDSDVRFPVTALERLLAHKKDIVGANFKQRTRGQWTARKRDKFVKSTGKQGIQRVDTLGMALTLIDMKVFTGKSKVPANAFAMPFDKSTGIFVGEDIYFCTVAGDNGFEVWVDHDLGNEVKHIGSVEL